MNFSRIIVSNVFKKRFWPTMSATISSATWKHFLIQFIIPKIFSEYKSFISTRSEILRKWYQGKDAKTYQNIQNHGFLEFLHES